MIARFFQSIPIEKIPRSLSLLRHATAIGGSSYRAIAFSTSIGTTRGIRKPWQLSYCIRFHTTAVHGDATTKINSGVTNPPSIPEQKRLPFPNTTIRELTTPSQNIQKKRTEWDRRYAELQTYKIAHGDCLVPLNPTNGLGRWVSHQRRTYKRILKNPKSPVTFLTPDRIAKLNSQNFDWDHLDGKWMRRMRQLREYKEAHGDCYVRSDYGKLGHWVKRQRVEYKEGTLKEWRVNELEYVGFVWDMKEFYWEEKVRLLGDFEEERGHCLVPLASGSLGHWVNKQRVEYKEWKEGRKSTLTKERVKCLTGMNFVWDFNEALWRQRYMELQEFKKEDGHCLVPETIRVLEEWMMNMRTQRKLYNQGMESSLTQDRIEKLDKADFIWDPFETLWRNNMEELHKFKEENGHCIVPQQHGDLGIWVNNVRNYYRQWKALDPNALMTQEKYEELEEVGFIWNVHDYQWWRMYHLAVEHKNHHVSHWPAKMRKKLGRWLNRQRFCFKLIQEEKRAPMKKDRVLALKKIGICS